ncbi:unnamed protein product [Aureobasidium mustum]|uniref:BTB domain-containing protein n=1 Tax=Aureobasidium mustum TaxID=2773714 RepID=A0A9N8PBP5_9PEZI|nr:unnamed protein product [Aureobasidium mustum]
MSTSSNVIADCPARYPYLQNSYNNAMLSDVVICFEDERVYAHKVAVMAASGVFNAAFNSKFPVADQGTFEIKGYSTDVVYAMLRHIYSKPPEEPSPARGLEEELEHHFAIFLIANEYEIQSLCRSSAQSVVQMIKSIPLPNPLPWYYQKWPSEERYSRSREQLSLILVRTATLYIDSKIADTSLLDTVLQTYFDLFSDLDSMKRHLKLCDA